MQGHDNIQGVSVIILVMDDKQWSLLDFLICGVSLSISHRPLNSVDYKLPHVHQLDPCVIMNYTDKVITLENCPRTT